MPVEHATITAQLIDIVKANVPDDFTVIEQDGQLEVNTSHPTEIAGRQREFVNLLSVIPQKNHVGFYFMPVYIEPSMRDDLSPTLNKMLKGKNCFHYKQPLTDELAAEVATLIQAGVKLYGDKGWR
jgi:hypothetical protein